MLGKYLERMADHVVIFAQWIIFSVTGERLVPEEDAAAVKDKSEEASPE